MREILFFHGQDCPHCAVMRPIVDRVEKKIKCRITRLEVWYNEKNAEKMRKYAKIIQEASGGEFGVPAFVDVKNNEALCGEQDEEDLQKWLMKK